MENFSMYGFSNALVFKTVTEKEIYIVEKCIRERTLLKISSDLCQTTGSEDVVIDDEQMRGYFSTNYVSNPSEFEFQPGEITYIKKLVEYVKDIVDGGGENVGLHKFEKKNKMNKTGRPEIAFRNKPTNLKESNDGSLKSMLLEKVIKCLKLRNIDGKRFNLDLNSLDVSLVKVFMESDNPLYGNITCILCAQKNKNKAYRVYYHDGKNGKYWVLSNFSKHLKKDHGLLRSK